MARCSRWLLLPALAVLAGCGTPGSSSSSATPSPTPVTTAATLSPTPTSVPDTLVVSVVASGLGAYEETTVPVAVLHNGAAAHAAQGVTVHFAVSTAAGRPALAVDAHVGMILPGQTLAAAARLDLRGTGDTVAVTVTAVASWPQAGPGADPRVPATVHCRTASCAGYGDVVGTLPPPLRGMPVIGVAVCRTAAGTIIGGNTVPFNPAPADGSVDVAVILSSAPASCELYATAGF